MRRRDYAIQKIGIISRRVRNWAARPRRLTTREDETTRQSMPQPASQLQN
jgi:hypothetical protein